MSSSQIKINGEVLTINIGSENYIEYSGKELTDELRSEEILEFKRFMGEFTRDQLIQAFIDVVNNGEE